MPSLKTGLLMIPSAFLRILKLFGKPLSSVLIICLILNTLLAFTQASLVTTNQLGMTYEKNLLREVEALARTLTIMGAAQKDINRSLYKLTTASQQDNVLGSLLHDCGSSNRVFGEEILRFFEQTMRFFQTIKSRLEVLQKEYRILGEYGSWTKPKTHRVHSKSPEQLLEAKYISSLIAFTEKANSAADTAFSYSEEIHNMCDIGVLDHLESARHDHTEDQPSHFRWYLGNGYVPCEYADLLDRIEPPTRSAIEIRQGLKQNLHQLNKDLYRSAAQSKEEIPTPGSALEDLAMAIARLMARTQIIATSASTTLEEKPGNTV